MKKISTIFLILTLFAYANTGFAQDSKRTTETKVADLLARIPAVSEEAFNTAMANMLALDESGLDMICRQIVAPGTGDDTRARYAISGMSYFLSKKPASEQTFWETLCIRYATQSSDNNVKSYFMNQLSIVGGDNTVEALAPSMADSQLCPVVISTLEAIGSEKAAKVITASLDSEKYPCTAQAINALVGMGYVNEAARFIKCYENGDEGVKKAAMTALALSGTEEAFTVLDAASKKASYKWEPTCAVSSLILYARTIGLKGNTKKMESITKTIIANSNLPETNNYRLSAMAVLTEIKKEAALPMLLKAINDPDIAVRGGVVRLALSIKGEEATKKWIGKYAKASEQAKPDIVYMLGERGDASAVPLIYKAMEDDNSAISSEAVTALAKLLKGDAVDPILSWIQRCNNDEGLNAAATAMTTILDSKNISKVAAQLKQSDGVATVTLINLISWSGDKTYFKTVLPYASSSDMAVRATAMKSLKNLAAEKDQADLINMVVNSVERPETQALQEALAIAANSNTVIEKRSDEILASLAKGASKEKLIPVLAVTGGDKALRYVLNEFETGNADLRDICFSTLAGWNDYSASEALYKICVSENKTFGKAAFEAYIRQIQSAPVTDDNRLLLYKKIAPYALYPDSRADMVVKVGKIHSYPAFFFVAKYLDDKDPNIAVWAAQALENIALPYDGGKTGLYGDIIKNGLERSLELISGPESEYDKEKIRKYLASMPQGEGFTPIFNGKDLTGWQGLVGDPISRAKMSPKKLSTLQKKANAEMAANWSVKDGAIVFNGAGNNLCTVKEYSDFEMFVDWKITKEGDSGIYLRGTPQVQIWDISRLDVGAQVGSGGLYNNHVNRSTPLTVADNKVGEWNTFHIIFTGDKVTVWLNGELVTDNTVFENYWDAAKPIFDKGAIELQAHGTDLQFRDLYVREISASDYNLTEEEKSEGFVSLFNGRNLNGWVGDTISYKAQDGCILVTTGNDFGGNLYTKDEYADFIYRFEFQLTPGANNGLGIRTPLEGDAAYVGMELQILDNIDPIYANLKPYQYHGSVYGVIPARRDFQNPVGEWNYEEVVVQGTHVKVTLNNTVIVDGDIAEARDNGTMDHKDHPGLKNTKGHIGFLGHGSVLRFRNIRIKTL